MSTCSSLPAVNHLIPEYKEPRLAPCCSHSCDFTGRVSTSFHSMGCTVPGTAGLAGWTQGQWKMQTSAQNWAAGNIKESLSPLFLPSERVTRGSPIRPGPASHRLQPPRFTAGRAGASGLQSPLPSTASRGRVMLHVDTCSEKFPP